MLRFTYIFVSLVLLLSLLACDTFIPQSTPESTMMLLINAQDDEDFWDVFWNVTTEDAILYEGSVAALLSGLEKSGSSGDKDDFFNVRYSKSFRDMAEIRWGRGGVIVMEKHGLKWYISCIPATTSRVEECYR